MTKKSYICVSKRNLANLRKVTFNSDIGVNPNAYVVVCQETMRQNLWKARTANLVKLALWQRSDLPTGSHRGSVIGKAQVIPARHLYRWRLQTLVITRNSRVDSYLGVSHRPQRNSAKSVRNAERVMIFNARKQRE